MKTISTAPLLIAIASLSMLTACGGSEPAPSDARTLPPVPATIAAPAQDAAAGNVALNPPHGQPGHVCELPVGAPLDGSVPAASAPVAADHGTVAAPITINPPPAAPQGAVTLPSGTPNPPHGQPGHRCEVNVGDPLP